jgi:hypothetical protein
MLPYIAAPWILWDRYTQTRFSDPIFNVVFVDVDVDLHAPDDCDSSTQKSNPSVNDAPTLAMNLGSAVP